MPKNSVRRTTRTQPSRAREADIIAGRQMDGRKHRTWNRGNTCGNARIGVGEYVAVVADGDVVMPRR